MEAFRFFQPFYFFICCTTFCLWTQPILSLEAITTTTPSNSDNSATIIDIVMTTPTSNVIDNSSSSISAACPCDCSTVSDEDCPLARYAPRGDCSCCKVCARQQGQTCDGLYMPCDRQFGLLCNYTTNMCEGKYDLRQAAAPSHTALTLRWEPFLHGSTEPNAFYYILYTETTQFTDDLRKWNSTTNWSQRPMIQVSGLQVAMPYFFLATIILNDTTKAIDYARRTEVIPLRTLGCRHNSQPFRVGDFFLDGCAFNCSCAADGRWACYERKCPHFYKLGDISDPRCKHEQDPAQADDPCCVIYTCPNGYDSREDKCVYEGASHELGSQFYTANCTERCYCDRLAIAQCEPLINCEPQPVPDNRTCFEWQVERDADRTRAGGACCPTYKCKNEGACIVDGRPYNNGDKLPSTAGSCSQQCECLGGQVRCKSHCIEPDVPILSSNCPKMVLVNDTQTCCSKWMCSIGADYCVKDNQMYPLDATWNDESCPIRKCQCQRGIGRQGLEHRNTPSANIAESRCHTQCPHIALGMLTSMSECLQPRIVEPEPDTCACPFVTCDPLYDEMTVDDLAYHIASATAAEISFSLPKSLLEFFDALSTRKTNATILTFAAVTSAEPIKALDLVVAETYPNNASIRHLHRLDLPYDSLLKERTSYTTEPHTRSKPTVVVRYVLQNLDSNMLYMVKVRLLLRDGVALPFSNEINITTLASTTSKAVSASILTQSTLAPQTTILSATTQPTYSTAAIQLVQQKWKTLSTTCNVPIRGVIETFNDGDAVMRNCTHLCRCMRGGVVECRYMCWSREHAMEMLQCSKDIVPVERRERQEIECCIQWRCQTAADEQQNYLIERTNPGGKTDGGTADPFNNSSQNIACISPHDQLTYQPGQTWQNRGCGNAMCLCTNTGKIECEQNSAFCFDLQPLMISDNNGCTKIEHIKSCCAAYSCAAEQNDVHGISAGLLVTLNLLRVDIRPTQSNKNDSNYWHTIVRVRWNVSQNLILRQNHDSKVELVWRALDEITSPPVHRKLIVDAHGEEDVVLNSQITSAMKSHNEHVAYELVLEATTAASSPSDVVAYIIKSNYIVFSLPLFLLAEDDRDSAPWLLDQKSSAGSFTTAATAAASSGTLAGINEFLFNTTGNKFPLGLLLVIFIGICVILCALAIAIVRCLLGRRGNALHPMSNISKASTTTSSSCVSHNAAPGFHQHRHGTATYNLNQAAATNSTTLRNHNNNANISQYDARLMTVSSAPQATISSASHQFYLKNTLDADIGSDFSRIGGVAKNSIGSTVGSRLAALNYDRHRNGLGGAVAVLPAPVVLANNNHCSKKRQKKLKKQNSSSDQHEHIGVYAIAPPPAVTLSLSSSSSTPLSTMTTPTTSIPDLRSSVVYNKYASFDNLVFTGK